MIPIRLVSAPLLFVSLAMAGETANPLKWKFAGEDRGIRFFFNTPQKTKDAPLLLKFENTLSIPVAVRFEVKDGDWKKGFEYTLAPNQIDSGIVDRPADRQALGYPDVGRVSLDIPDFDPLERYSAAAQ